MKKKWKILGVVLGILILFGTWFVMTPKDIRPDYLNKQIEAEDFQKGALMLAEMQNAYGGMEKWLSYETGSYRQIADWYDDKLGVAGWDELPQQFEMTSTLGTDDSEFTLLNGVNKGQVWGVQDWKSYQKKEVKKHSFIMKSTTIN